MGFTKKLLMLWRSAKAQAFTRGLDAKAELCDAAIANGDALMGTSDVNWR